MSKYIKLDDAISKIVNTPTRVITNNLTALADRQHEIIDMLADLPTIEVSEDDLYIPLNNQTVERINRLHKDECGDYFDEEWLFNELEQISEFREVSEDCISRAWVQNKLTEYVKDYELNDLDSWQNTIVEWIATAIEDAPSVIPKPKEGEWIRQGISPHEGIQICSLCGAMYDITAEFDNCPNCHAKMKGADDDI